MKNIIFFLLLSLISISAFAQIELLQSGPMVGSTAPGRTKFWVQTKKEAMVKIKYFELSASDKIYFFTYEYKATKEEGYTAIVIADKTLPNRNYQYELYLNNILVLRPYPLSFRTGSDTSSPLDFKVAIGSCVYVNDSLVDKDEALKGSAYEIYNSISAQKPDMMLWLGDNVYFRKSDWGSREGMMYRYTHTRHLAQLQPLLGSTENIAIWDDHDFGPNDSDGTFKNKKTSLELFKLFWANPTYCFDSNNSIASTFSKGDVQFFLLDDRSFRSPKETDSDDKKELLGEQQLTWLIRELKSSTATFKIIAMGGQVLNPLKVFETYSNFKEEHEKLLRQLENEKISGVVFLSGDRHFSEVMKMERKTYPLYEFTASPLNSRPYEGSGEKNKIRVAGSLIQVNNFATLDFSGKGKERIMKVQYRDKNGVLLFEKTVMAEELK